MISFSRLTSPRLTFHVPISSCHFFLIIWLFSAFLVIVVIVSKDSDSPTGIVFEFPVAGRRGSLMAAPEGEAEHLAESTLSTFAHFAHLAARAVFVRHFGLKTEILYFCFSH